jgi:nitrate reductase delta subunit
MGIGYARTCLHYRSYEQADVSALKRVERDARAGFRLVDAVPVRVEELAATEKGFPPRETRITFWTGNQAEHRYRVFKPASQVTDADLPPWWMKDALILDDFPFCDCCG